MKLIDLCKINKYVRLDEDDLERFGHLYAYVDDQGRVVVSQGDKGKAFLSRLILVTDLLVDHIDGYSCNNCKSNLREATRSQNMQNSSVRLFSKTGYKGVSWHKASKKFRARIKVNGVGDLFLGSFSDARKAALAYNEAAIKYFGEFAKLNKVPV